jgi:Neprosin
MRLRFASPLSSASICSRSLRVLAVLLGLLAFAAGPAAAQDPPPPNSTAGAAPATTPDATEAARAIEAARVQAFLEARYKPSDVKHFFRTKLGDTIDCIDFFAQAGVKALAARGTPIMKPPPSVARPRRPDALFDGEPDENGNRRQCPDGTVPQVRITPEQIQSAGGLDAWLSRIKKFALPGPSGSKVRGASNLAPPEPGLPGFAHTYHKSTGNNLTSGEAALSVYNPSIPNADKTDHSLMQTWTATGANNATAATSTTPAAPCAANCQQTVEAGWTLDPGLNSDNNPHFFVYSTPNGYWSGVITAQSRQTSEVCPLVRFGWACRPLIRRA